MISHYIYTALILIIAFYLHMVLRSLSGEIQSREQSLKYKAEADASVKRAQEDVRQANEDVKQAHEAVRKSREDMRFLINKYDV